MSTLPPPTPPADPYATPPGVPPAAPPGTPAGSFPPVTQLAVASMAMVIVGGIWLAAHLPARPDLAPAIGLLAAGGLLLLVTVALLSRIRPFAWDRFFLVARWGLLAYLVIAGLLEYVFAYDGTRGATLAILSLSLLVFALDVPLILGFTVARYAAPPETAQTGRSSSSR